MKRWRWILLIFELALFATILVVPHVDLPDFEFHGGTAPVAAKSRISTTPVAVTACHVAMSVPERTSSPVDAGAQSSEPLSAASRLTLLCTLIC